MFTTKEGVGIWSEGGIPRGKHFGGEGEAGINHFEQNGRGMFVILWLLQIVGEKTCLIAKSLDRLFLRGGCTDFMSTIIGPWSRCFPKNILSL